MRLWAYFRSSTSYRLRIALNLKGLEYRLKPVHLVNNGGEQHSAEHHGDEHGDQCRAAVHGEGDRLVPAVRVEGH